MNRFLTILVFLTLSMGVWAGCDTAVEVAVGEKCSYQQYTLTSSAGKVTSSDCGWTTYGYKEVWLKCVMPESGRLSIASEGNYLNGFIAVYTGTCGELKTHKCSNNGRLPEVLDINDIKAGETVYIRAAMMSDTSVGLCLYSLENIDKPECSGETIAADLCANATLIQSANGYCGNTSASYTAEKPGNLQNVFCGSIENNSWIQFVASADTAKLNIFTHNCKMGIGIQMRIYETEDCKTFKPYSNCWNPAIETNGVVEATGLTPGKRYYLMIDGYAGDVCDYTIQAGEGVETPQTFIEDVICSGKRYQKYGFDVSEAGVYRQELVGPRGNDSLVVLTLTEGVPVYTYFEGHIYSCERYTEHGFDVNTEGKHYQYLTAASGCDSTVVLTLEVEPKKQYDLYATICEGSYYAYNGFYENKAGDYTRTEKTAQGCDSVINLHLTVKSGLDLEVSGDKDLCSGEGTTMFASGGIKYIWKDADGNVIGEGDSIQLKPSATTTYKLYSSIVSGCPSTVTDREKNTYPVVRIGNQCWMAENLKVKRYDTESERPGAYIYPAGKMTEYSESYLPTYYDPKDASTRYTGNLTASHRAKLGYLYTWAAAVGLETEADALAQVIGFEGDRQGICPNGWHVPDSLEIKNLFNALGGIEKSGKKLKTVDGWYKGPSYAAGTDDFDFSLLPSAFSYGNSPQYTGANGSFWSADPYRMDEKKATDAYTYYNLNSFKLTNNEKYYGRAVRCVRRAE